MSKNLSFHEVGKMLGVSNKKIIDFLSENKMLFKSNKTNLPYQTYINKGFFKVFYVEKDEKFFPMVRVTQKGFKFIKDSFYSDDMKHFENKVNQTMFSQISSLGGKYDKKDILIKTEPNNDVTYYYYFNEQFIPIIKYNKYKKIIETDGIQ